MCQYCREKSAEVSQVDNLLTAFLQGTIDRMVREKTPEPAPAPEPEPEDDEDDEAREEYPLVEEDSRNRVFMERLLRETLESGRIRSVSVEASGWETMLRVIIDPR